MSWTCKLLGSHKPDPKTLMYREIEPDFPCPEPMDIRRFEKLIMEMPEVVECDSIMGDVDYILKFLVSSLDRYQEVLERMIDADIGIAKYSSHLRSKSVKRIFDSPVLNLQGCGTDIQAL